MRIFLKTPKKKNISTSSATVPREKPPIHPKTTQHPRPGHHIFILAQPSTIRFCWYAHTFFCVAPARAPAPLPPPLSRPLFHDCWCCPHSAPELPLALLRYGTVAFWGRCPGICATFQLRGLSLSLSLILPCPSKRDTQRKWCIWYNQFYKGLIFDILITLETIVQHVWK